MTDTTPALIVCGDGDEAFVLHKDGTRPADAVLQALIDRRGVVYMVGCFVMYDQRAMTMTLGAGRYLITKTLIVDGKAMALYQDDGAILVDQTRDGILISAQRAASLSLVNTQIERGAKLIRPYDELTKLSHTND